MTDKLVQWHPGFVAAMDLEFHKNRGDLEFQNEYHLNTKPLAVDLLIRKRDVSVSLANEIGAIFRGHNILEYKSPEDQLDMDVFYKTEAYASLYKAYGKHSDEIKAEDITVTIIREAKPVKLFCYLREHSYRVTNPYRGIYYIEGRVAFPTQIVVTEELDRKAHVWLGALSKKLQKEDMLNLLEHAELLTEKDDMELADSVLQISIGLNKRVVEELRGDGGMCKALMEIMEPELLQREREGIEKGIEKGIQKGLMKGIQGAVEALRDLGHGDVEIRDVIIRKYKISMSEAEGYLS